MDSVELPEQSQSGKSEVEESYKNDVEGGGEWYVEANEENKSKEKEEKIKKKEEEVESEKEDDDKNDDNVSSMGPELRTKSQHDLYKTISIDRFQIDMSIDDPAYLTSDLIFESQLGKPFDDLRKIMKEKKIDEFFKKSHFWTLS